MEGVPSPGTEFIVYIDHSDIHRGRIDDLKAGVNELVNVMGDLEPQLMAYGFHFDDDAGRMTVTAVHPDSASLELHLGLGREKFRELGAMLTLRQIEVYGPISDLARSMLEQKAEMLGGAGITVLNTHAGFARPRA
ncbi:MAG TPA: hypothetical protein VMZ66_13570 [Aeromicrobium sp.]|nr:hypothetical protein [Aeromicrobium sp.]